jgi:16S rRNA U516 pseudouridylate synthase RsuA-like enzyme
MQLFHKIMTSSLIRFPEHDDDRCYSDSMTYQKKKLSHHFWDLRKDCLPLFRAIQSVQSLAVFTDQDDEVDDASKIQIHRVPCKQEIQKVLDEDLSKITVLQDETSRIHYSKTSEKKSLLTIDTMIHLRSNRILVESSVGRFWFGESINIPASSDDSSTFLALELGWAPEYAILYKPRRVLCTLAPSATWDKAENPSLLEHMHRLCQISDSSSTDIHHPRISSIRPLNHVGRLDLESEGLLLLTNDGTFQFGCTSPEVGLPKTYRVLVRTRPGRGKLGQLDRTSNESDVLSALQAELCTVSNDVNGITSSEEELPNNNLAQTGLNLVGAAESMRLVDFTCMDNLTQSHWSNHGESLIPKSNSKTTTTATTTSTTTTKASSHSSPKVWFFLLDVALREGAKRQVRRLFRSLEMTTLMLIRIQLGSISVSTVCPNDSSVEYMVPQTIQDAFVKCNDYSRVQQTCPEEMNVVGGTFRYLTKLEVDSIFNQIIDRSVQQH